METLTEILVKILIETVLISGILGFIFKRREVEMKNKIEEEFRKRDKFFDARLNFKQRSLEELLGPIVMQLKRTQDNLGAYTKNNDKNDAKANKDHRIYRENILKTSNEIIRNLLLTKGFLIPPALSELSGDLLRHYDNWLQKYHQIREIEEDNDTGFIFTYDFPPGADEKIIAQYEKFRNELNIDESMR